MFPASKSLYLFGWLLILSGTLCQMSFAEEIITNTSPTSPTTNLAPPPSARDKLNESLAAAGITYQLNDNNLDIVIDEKSAVDAVPMLEKEEMIPSINPDDIRKLPITLSVGVVGVSFTILLVNQSYSKNDTLDNLHVHAYIMPMDKSPKQLCFSFDYTRATYSALDFRSLTPKDFITNTPGFTFSEWCKTGMDQESPTHS